jgi:Rrf2 family protein
MELTRKGDYAVRVVVDLASHPPDAAVRSRDIGRRTGVPPAYLGKIIQTLAQAGLVRTRRGALGGVTLGRPPERITLRQVVEAVEGPISLNRCLVRPGLCPRDRLCAVHPVWARIQTLLTRELDAVSIAELAAVTTRLAAPRQKEPPMAAGRDRAEMPAVAAR